jgi:hypothetical protein
MIPLVLIVDDRLSELRIQARLPKVTQQRGERGHLQQ